MERLLQESAGPVPGEDEGYDMLKTFRRGRHIFVIDDRDCVVLDKILFDNYTTCIINYNHM